MKTTICAELYVWLLKLSWAVCVTKREESSTSKPLCETRSVRPGERLDWLSSEVSVWRAEAGNPPNPQGDSTTNCGCLYLLPPRLSVSPELFKKRISDLQTSVRDKECATWWETRLTFLRSVCVTGWGWESTESTRRLDHHQLWLSISSTSKTPSPELFKERISDLQTSVWGKECANFPHKCLCVWLRQEILRIHNPVCLAVIRVSTTTSSGSLCD